MGDDFVYGVANAADVSTEAAGNVIFPMYQIKILDVSSDTPSVLKTYEKNGYYVSGVDIEDYTMYLNRIQYNGTAAVLTVKRPGLKYPCRKMWGKRLQDC